MHALRAREARQQIAEEQERYERERAAVTQELALLRTQPQARTDSEKELRLLLASAQQAVQGLTEQKALPAPEVIEKPRRRWWFIGRRG